MKHRNKAYSSLTFALLLLAILPGCGGGSKSSPRASVTVSPASVSMIAGATQQFTAIVRGTTSTAVTWSLSGCNGSACGTIDANGLYTTPSRIPSATSVQVVATLKSDTTKTGSARVDQIPVSMKISPSSVEIGAADSYQITATVSGTTNTLVTWSLSSCPLGACGAVSASGVYTAPPSVESDADVTVTATSQADSSKFITCTVHLRAILVTIDPEKSVNVAINATQNFSAKVNYDLSNAGVVWSLGAACAPDTCGALSNVTNTSVTYTAPAAVPNPATVTLTATSVTDPTKKASVLITVTKGTAHMQPGDYAFVFSGWKGLGGGNFGRQITVGHFHADASGNITEGVQDVNDDSGVSLSVSITGTYTVNPNYRGTLTIASANETATYSMTVDPTGTKGNFIRLNSSTNPCLTQRIHPATGCDYIPLASSASQVSGAGFFEKQQNTSAYSLSNLAGSYALLLNAKANDSMSMAAVGRFTVSSNGTLSKGEMDMLAPTATYKQLTLGGTVDAPSNTTGRGTASLTLTPAPGMFSGSMQFVYYVVSADKVLLMQTDARGASAPLLSGEARRQTESFSKASFNAPAIFQLAGMHSTVQSVVVGQMTPDGNGSMTGIFDQNFESNVTLDQSFNGTYTVDSQGRSTLTMLGGTAVAYFFGPNQAYLIEQPRTDILYGNLKPQTVGSYSPAALSTLRFAEAEAISAFSECDSGIMTFDGDSAFTLEQDYTFFFSDGTYMQGLGQTQSGSYMLDANGRGVINLTVSGNNLTIPFWVVSSDEMTAVDTATGGLDSLPVVLHFWK